LVATAGCLAGLGLLAPSFSVSLCSLARARFLGDVAATEGFFLGDGRATRGAKAAENVGLNLFFDGEAGDIVESVDFNVVDSLGVKENGTEAAGVSCSELDGRARLGAEFEEGG
jgi:hypothetical protein